MTSKDSFVLFTSYSRKVQRLNMEQRGVLFTAILAHENGEDMPEMDDATAMAFDFICDDLDENRRRYEERCAKSKGSAEKRWNDRMQTDATVCERMPTHANACERMRTDANDADNDNDMNNDSDNDLKDKKKSTRKARPTREEVREYCLERKNTVNPDQFFDYYESQKWKKANGRPVEDWKACVRTWECREKEREKERPTIKAVKQNQFTAFEDRHSYDFDSLAGILSQPVGGVL